MAFITDLKVSLSKSEEEDLRRNGYLSVPGNLKGDNGKQIHFWYKRGPSGGITAIQFSFNEQMSAGLHSAQYQKINTDLDAGSGKGKIYLWFKKRSTEFDVPIVQLHVTTKAEAEVEMFRLGWERLACDLNRNVEGNRIHLWVQRERPTYICDIKATADYQGDDNNFNAGWNRVDEDTNRGVAGAPVFIWYRQSQKNSNAIKKVNVSTNHTEYSELDGEGYEKVKQNLNQKTEGNQVYLWYKKEGDGEAIQAITALVKVIDAYKKAGVPITDRNLNEGNDGERVVLYYYPE